MTQISLISHSAGAADEANGHRGLQWDHQDLWGAVRDSGALQQRVPGEIPTGGQWERDSKVDFFFFYQSCFYLVENNEAKSSLFRCAGQTGSRATRSAWSLVWKRSMTVSVSWNRTWGSRSPTTERSTRRWTASNRISCSSARSETSTWCKGNELVL